MFGTYTGCCCEGEPCYIIPLCSKSFDVLSGTWIIPSIFSSDCTLTCTAPKSVGVPGVILHNNPSAAPSQKITTINSTGKVVRLIIDAQDEDNYLCGEVSKNNFVFTYSIIRVSGGADNVLFSRSVNHTPGSGQIFNPPDKFQFCYNQLSQWAVLDVFVKNLGSGGAGYNPMPIRTQAQTTHNGNTRVGFGADPGSGGGNVILKDYSAIEIYDDWFSSIPSFQSTHDIRCEICVHSPLPQCSACPPGVRPEVMFVTLSNVKNFIPLNGRCGNNCPQFNVTYALPRISGGFCQFLLEFNPDKCAGDIHFGSDPLKGYTKIIGTIGGSTNPYTVIIQGAVPNNNNSVAKIRYGFEAFGLAKRPPPGFQQDCATGLDLFFLSTTPGVPCIWSQSTCHVEL